MQQDDFDISLFPKKETPAIGGDFDITVFPKKQPEKPEELDMSLFPKKVQAEKKKALTEKVGDAIGPNGEPISMAELYQYGSTPPQIDPDLEEINPLSRAFYYKPPDIQADQTAVPATPEMQFQLDQKNQAVAEMIRTQENEQWNTLTLEQKDEYLIAAAGGKMGRAESYGNLISGTVFKLAADIPKWSGAISQKFDKWITGESKPVEAYSAYYTGMKIQQMLDELYPTNKDYAGDVGGQLIQGAASMIPYVFTGSWVAGLTGVAKAAVPSAVAVGFMGAAQNSVPEYDRLISMHRDAHKLEQRDFLDKWSTEGKPQGDLQKTYDKLKSDTGTAEDYAWGGFIANSLTGVTEGLSMGWGINNIQKFLGPGWTSKLVSMLESGGVEGFQESLTEYVANMSAIQAYDFQRRWYDNVAASGGIGALMGMVTFGIAGGLARQLDDPNLDPRKKAIILKAIEENQKAAEMVPADPNEIVPPKTSEQSEAEIQAQDTKIIENQRRLGLSTNPLQEYDKNVNEVLTNAKNNKTTDLKRVQNAETFLYSEYKRINAIKNSSNRQFSIKQLNVALNQLEEQLHLVGNYRQAIEELETTREFTWDIKNHEPLGKKEEDPKPLSKTERVRKKIIRHVVETVDSPPRTEAEKAEVLATEAKLAAEEKATLGNPDAKPVIPVKVDPTPVAEEELPEGSKKQKPHRYFSTHGDQTGLTSHKRKDSNFVVSKEGEVDIIEGKEKTIISSQAYNPLYESTNLPQSVDDAVNVVTKPVIDPKTGEVLKRGELYFGDVKPTKKKATEDMVNREQADHIQSLIQSGEITYTDDNGKPCASAGGRMNDFTRGQKWEIVKDLKGYPSHAKGGVDLKITGSKIMFKNHNGLEIHAKQGLLVKCR